MMKSLVVTLDIGYPAAITQLTFPLMRQFAHNIGADFHVIAHRQWPDLPLTLEKMQLHELCRDRDWTIFLDADCVVNPIGMPPDWRSHDGIWVSQFMPLTQFRMPLSQHCPTYFLAFPQQHRDCVMMPLDPMSWTVWVKHHDESRRAWLLDDLIINHNITSKSISCRPINPNVVAHMGHEGCTMQKKIDFIRQNLDRLPDITA